MKSERVLFLSLFLGLLATSICFSAWRSREPSFQGRSVTSWIRQVSSTAKGEQFMAIQTVRSIGPEAVPHLLKGLRKRDPRWVKYYQQIRLKLPSGIRSIFPDLATAEEMNFGSTMALANIGSTARSGLSELLDFLSSAGTASRIETLIILSGFLAPQDRIALVPLLKTAKDSDAQVREAAFYALSKLKTTAEDGIPAALEALTDNAPRVRLAAALALHEISPSQTERPLPAS